MYRSPDHRTPETYIEQPSEQEHTDYWNLHLTYPPNMVPPAGSAPASGRYKRPAFLLSYGGKITISSER